MSAKNIVFIVIDTLRKDYSEQLEKELKQLGFVSYDNVIAPGPWTMPSHASIFTGLYPILHGAHETKKAKSYEVKLRHNRNILSLELKDLNYRTYLLSANLFIHPKQGFIGFDNFYWTSYFPSCTLLSASEREKIKELKEEKIFGNSLIIITSDHGQLLGEHGRIGHGAFLYDELLKVPLLIKYPEKYKIRHVEIKYKYISLTKLRQLILGIVNNELRTDEILYNNVAFAETFGIPVHTKPKNTEEKKNIEDLEKYRIAIYYNEFKGIFNVTDWKFEKIVSYNPNIEITEDIKKQMRQEIMKFLNLSLTIKKLI